MTDQEAKALEAASRQFKERDHGLTEACRAYHAAMLEGQVVISREDAGRISGMLLNAYGALKWETLLAHFDLLRAQLGEGK